MRLRIIALILGLSLIAAACGGDDDLDYRNSWDNERIEVVGEITALKVRSWTDVPKTLFTVGSGEDIHYFGIVGPNEILEVGQRVKVTYQEKYRVRRYQDGRLERTGNHASIKHLITTEEAQYNTDGSITFVKIKWIELGWVNVVVLSN